LGLNTSSGFSPFVSYQNEKQHRAQFDEYNSIWGNRFYTQDTFIREAAVGFELNADEVMFDGNQVRSSLRVFGTHDFSTDRGLTGSSLTATDFSYQITGLRKEETQLHLNLKVDAELSRNSNLAVDLGLNINGSDTGGSASFSYISKF
jgi:hypothetical protein